MHAKNTDRIRKEDPLYFSFCQISGNQQKVAATELEFREGGQLWDLNPLIFYRIQKPLKDLNTL